MSVIGSNILAGASGQGGGYNLTNSLRFRSSATANLQRTPATTTSQTTWTWSGWVKRGKLGSVQYIFGTYPSSGQSNSTWIEFGFDSSDILIVGGWTVRYLGTTQVFRDPSAWYHIVLAIDSTQATSSNRVKFYVNGVQITAFATNNAPSLNQTMGGVNSTVVHCIGNSYPLAGTNPFDGYIAETNFIDGQALTPSSFGETSATTGVWIPKKYTGTYGTNGFYLPFTDNSALTTSSNVGLGKDFSGNGNYWTTNNISITSGTTYDSMTDVPTLTSATAANYCVLNPLDNGGTTPSAGNLELTAGAAERGVRSTMAIPTTGTFYMEALVGTNQSGATDIAFGFVARTTNLAANPSGISNGWLCYASATTNITRNGTSTLAGTGTALVAGDVLQLAIDLANNKGWLGKNNTWFNGSTGTDGNPSTGANPTFTFSSPPELFVLAHGYLSTINVNFGQQPFSYTPPTGFVRLNTFNLPTPTIGATASTQAGKYFNTVLYTGNGSSQTVTGFGFDPDMVWHKGRSVAYNHSLVDVIRGNSNILFSNTTDAEANPGAQLALATDGATVTYRAANLANNQSSATYVIWGWKANGAGSSNTAGSITSTVSANTSSGFSVVTYTGTGSAATVGHGLGASPKMIIVKDRSATNPWAVYHVDLGVQKYIFLNATDAAFSNLANYWGSTAPSSTTFGIGAYGGINANSDNYVAYCFAEIAGYSAFGSYTGNGSSDGTFVYTGFRPRFLMMKRSSSGTANWYIFDSARSTYNAIDVGIYPNLSNAETALGAQTYDFLSNGFKLRQTNADFNESGIGYIYMAFAENPFKYANAR
jgi:hypothetical protein